MNQTINTPVVSFAQLQPRDTSEASEDLPRSKRWHLHFDQRNVGIFLTVLKELNLNKCFKDTVF